MLVPPSNKDICDAVGYEPDMSYAKPSAKEKAAEAKALAKASPQPRRRSPGEGDSSHAETASEHTKDYVAATLSAWNSCPSIVKRQLDKQND